ncbi:MAG: hypothetical protein IPN29_13410 [Saprospiraceae bacterium]|nr:hypothetical protein [Saprospiraceae bacterium]
MKNLLILIFFPLCVNAQIQVKESIVSFQKKYNPLFSKESGLVTMDFYKEYTFGLIDTSFKFKISIMNRQIEESGGSTGVALGTGGNFAFGLSNSYTINKENRSLELNKEEFMDFYSSINKIFVISGVPQNKGKMMFTYEESGLIFGAQFDDSKTEQNSYYLAIEGAIYPLPKLDFIEIVTKIRAINAFWTKA